MSGSVAYVDTSAFVELIVAEHESEALRIRLRRWPDRASATLLRTETVRALRRSGNEHLVGKARRLLATVHLIRIDEPLLDRAGDLGPPELRSLDAIHLAAALSIGADLGVVVSYDSRLREAAIAQGLHVEGPC
ncbi:MAG: type II toxin-antitoxin system VapC family toxin [Actinomycetota bacterium]|nr:type II toxin-antitoxin system VapC family toxin [Actinomycetota bacterium]